MCVCVLSLQVHPGVWMPGSLCVFHHPNPPGVLLTLPPHPGMMHTRTQDSRIFRFLCTTFTQCGGVSQRELIKFILLCTDEMRLSQGKINITEHVNLFLC